MLSNIAVAIDCEHDRGRLIEVGLTTIDVNKFAILTKYSIPIKVNFRISEEIHELTGWTQGKLNKAGLNHLEAAKQVLKVCGKNRLLITDMDDEIPFIEEQLGIRLNLHRFNVSTSYKILACDMSTSASLETMLADYGLTFEGKQHRANDDSYNIARLFLAQFEDK